MKPKCPYCVVNCPEVSDSGHIRRNGFFYRSSDRIYLRRWRCKRCNKSFSSATGDPSFRQKKRHLNDRILQELASTNSQRRIARNLKINRKTVVRKFMFLAEKAERELKETNRARPITTNLLFDDMESRVHTKLKPVSMLVVVDGEREILGVGVASMPASGHLAKRSVEKYGPRKDERREMRLDVLKSLLPFTAHNATFTSDKNPYYPDELRQVFPAANHITFMSKRPRADGQGELKKIGNDPLWKINHTNAMFRANVNRLLKKTWCTTKKQDRLRKHMIIYAVFHNRVIQAERQKLADNQNSKPRCKR